MRNTGALKILSLLTLCAGAVFCLILFISDLALANGHPLQCQNIFHPNSSLLIAMNPEYRGENTGKYTDPVTKTKWNVKYYTSSELKQYEVIPRDNLLTNSSGKKISSEFDAEAMSFEHGLFVIDKNYRMYLLPFEIRGTYHHSSLSRGDDIIFAGTAAFHNGILKELSNSSGHYKPSSQQTLVVLKQLSRRGINLSETSLSGQAAEDLTGTYSIGPKELRSLLAGRK